MTDRQNLGGPRIVSNNPQAAAQLVKWQVGGTLDETVKITNPNPDPPYPPTLTWETKITYPSGGQVGWLQVTPSTAPLNASATSGSINVSVNKTNLKPGKTYTARAHFIWTNYAGPDNGDTLEITFTA